MRPGWPYSAAALLLACVASWVARSGATEAVGLATQLLVFALIVLTTGLIFGVPLVVAASAVPVLGAIVLESALVDEPSWIRALVVGCLWYVTVEMGYEALDRRDGSRRTSASVARRVQEVSLVIALSLAIGLVSSVALPLAPVRSVLLQATVLIAVLAVVVVGIRGLASLVRR